MKLLINSSILALIATGCSIETEDRVNGPASIVSSLALSGEVVSANLDDALETMVDSNNGSSAITLQLAGGQPALAFNGTRSCESAEDQTAVTIERDMSGSGSFETLRRSVNFEVSKTGTINRVWKNSTKQVDCSEDNKYAQPDLENEFANTSLDITFERSKTRTSSVTHKQSDKTKNRSRSYTASGSRKINFTNWVDNGDETITVERYVESSVERSHTIGEENFSIKLETVPEKPMLIESTKTKSSKQLVSKTIHSGSLKATTNDDTYTISEFNELKLSFENDECSFTSGSVTTAFYQKEDADADADADADGDGMELVKTLTLEIADGDYTLTDGDGNEITDFELPECSRKLFSK